MLLLVIPFAFMGSTPLFGLSATAALGPWRIWAGVLVLGAGAAICLLPTVPAALAAADQVTFLHVGMEVFC